MQQEGTLGKVCECHCFTCPVNCPYSRRCTRKYAQVDWAETRRNQVQTTLTDSKDDEAEVAHDHETLEIHYILPYVLRILEAYINFNNKYNMIYY